MCTICNTKENNNTKIEATQDGFIFIHKPEHQIIIIEHKMYLLPNFQIKTDFLLKRVFH